MQESRRQFLAAAAAGVTGLLAGCGGTDTETPVGTAGETGTATAESPPTATDGSETESDRQTETATAENPFDPPGSTADPAQTVTVGPDGDYQFAPSSFTVSVGDTVTWEWASGGHNVKPDAVPEGSDWAGTSGTGTYASGYSYSYTFDTAGEYEYHCSPHQGLGMVGSFTVSDE